MKKDIEWLKKWIYEYENKIIKELGDKFTDDFMTTRLHGGQSAVKEIKYRINQLDEPEDLTQELPVIPKFVAEWIDVAKSRHHTLLQAMDEYAPKDIKEWVWKYFNSDLLGKAWLAYPNIEMEEEQKYRVVIGNYVLRKWNNSDTFRIVLKNSPKENIWSGCKIELTEKEIKAIDERFWAFAEEVQG